MKKTTYLLLCIFGIVVSLGGCYYDNEEELYPDSFNCTVGTVNYESDIAPIINTNCAISGCHVSGTGRKDLSTYQGVKDIADDGRLKDRVIITRDMPPSGVLSNCDIAAIDAWIQQGGPLQ